MNFHYSYHSICLVQKLRIDIALHCISFQYFRPDGGGVLYCMGFIGMGWGRNNLVLVIS